MGALRDAGHQAEAGDDHFETNAEDAVWLPEVGKRGWILLTKDKAIRTNQLERDALLKNNVAAFMLGNPANFPANITTITDSDAPSGVTFSTPLEQLADRTKTLVADLQQFTTGVGTWTKPALAEWVSIVAVGKGGAGGNSAGPGLGGGARGGAGEVRTVHLPASLLPATLTITFTSGAPVITGTGINIAPKPGAAGAAGVGGSGGSGGTPGGLDAFLSLGQGGAGGNGTSAPGGAGSSSLGGGAGGAGGVAGAAGAAGVGCGAGGGGGGGGGAPGGGGGGGAGGFGNDVVASPGVGASGGASGPGVVRITTWRAP